jgi:hypothetical protein
MDVTTLKSFFDLGGLVVLAGLSIGSVYKLSLYILERERHNTATYQIVVDKLTGTIDRNTESNTKLYEAVLRWDRQMRRTGEDSLNTHGDGR